MRALTIIAKCVVLLFVISVVSLIALTAWYSHIPSDKEVQERFDRDKPFLVLLLNKLAQEPTKIVGVTKDKVMVDSTSNWISPDKAGFSSEHFAEYEIWRSDGETVFAIAGWGWASNGWRLSFDHPDVAPDSQVSSIDHPPVTAQEGSVVYRPLGDGWYIRLIY
jgi:hypothetical protein